MKRSLIVFACIMLVMTCFFVFSAEALFGMGKKTVEKPKRDVSTPSIASSGIVNVGEGAVSPEDAESFQAKQQKQLEATAKMKEDIRRQQEAERMQQIRQQGIR